MMGKKEKKHHHVTHLHPNPLPQASSSPKRKKKKKSSPNNSPPSRRATAAPQPKPDDFFTYDVGGPTYWMYCTYLGDKRNVLVLV
mmetsp:Transcript_4489/g.14917  ORF Transcript_4489/g.14917 Transcript_4489/m.14917 type:complete len:85 (+) Transcript_4489:2853-3107(+)